MAVPKFSFQVAFANGPLENSPVWVDISDDLDSFTVSRGRQTEDDQAQTGTLTATLVDDERKYDPNNEAGEYYPNIKVKRQLQVLATHSNGRTYSVFRGNIDPKDGWVRTEGDVPSRALVACPANDAFDLLNGIQILGSSLDGPVELSGTRIVRVLDEVQAIKPLVGWTLATSALATGTALAYYEPILADIDAGNEDVQATDATTRQSALQWIRDAEATEPGFVYVDQNGQIQFRDRLARYSSTSVATFCDSANEASGRVLYDSLTTRRTTLMNDVIVSSAGNDDQEEIDVDSQTEYGPMSNTYTTKHTSDFNADQAALFQLNRHKESYETLESLVLVPGDDEDAWLQYLERDINDRITVIRTPPGESEGGSVTEDYFIEAVAPSYGPGITASVTFRLSPAVAYVGWVLEDAQYLLGENTFIAY